jgi:hypothetical protein
MDNQNSKMETFVSIVLILDYTEMSAFESYVKELQSYLHVRYSDYEIIIIDQNRNTSPLSIKENILNLISSIRWIALSFPVEMDVALSAGIENAIGDFVVLMRPTVDPVNIVEDMVHESSRGYDVIIGIAPRTRTLGYKIARKISTKLLHSIDYHIPQNATPVRCLSRRAINTVLRTGNINHQFFIKVANTGYPSKTYSYELLDTRNLQKRTLSSGISQTMKLMVFNSTKPLRWINLLGVAGSFMALVFAIYSIIVNILKDDVIEGWTSMVFFSSFLFMILFIILAFLGEYLARLLNEQGQQKSYYISSEETSSIMLETDRFNVLEQS